MDSAAAAIFMALLTWWFSTGAVLFLDGLPRRTFSWSMAAGAALGAAGLTGVWLAPGSGVIGAYLAFLSAIAVWAFAEIAFLLGLITGPRRTPCPPGLEGPPRFVAAAQTVIHHELLLAGLGIAVGALAYAGANPVAFWTFLALWLMRLSTKLNIFMGVPNAAEELLPPHLSYLESYFGPRRVNPLFPLFATLATIATLLVAQAAWRAGAAGLPVTGLVLVATLMALAVLEHWLLVLPLKAAKIWAWGLSSRRAAPAPEAQAAEIPERPDAKAPCGSWTGHVPVTGVKP